jgi:hypothetical protein
MKQLNFKHIFILVKNKYFAKAFIEFLLLNDFFIDFDINFLDYFDYNLFCFHIHEYDRLVSLCEITENTYTFGVYEMEKEFETIKEIVENRCFTIFNLCIHKIDEEYIYSLFDEIKYEKNYFNKMLTKIYEIK